MRLKKLLYYWPLFTIISLSAILRFWRAVPLTTIGGDLGYDLINVKQILEGNITLLGPRIGPYNNISSLFLGPFYYYLIAPFLWITKFDPIGVSYATIIARIITTVFIYITAKKLFNNSTAIVSAFISSLSPYWFNYLGFPSNPYFILPIVAVIIYLLINFEKKTTFKLVSIGFLTGLATQLHYISLIIIPALLLIIVAEKNKAINKITSFFVGFFIAIFPMVIFEIKHQFFLTQQIIKQLTSGSFNPNITLLGQNLKIVSKYVALDMLGWEIAYPIVAVILFFWAFSILKKSSLKFKIVYYFILNLIILNTLAAILYPGDIQPHYLAVAYPGVFIVISSVISNISKINKKLFLTILVIISISLFAKNNFFSSSGYTMPEDLTLKEVRQISKIISEDAGNESFNIVSMLDGDSRALPYRYLVQVYGKTAESVEHYDTPQSLYIITRDPTTSITKNQLFEISSFQPSHVANKWEIKGNIKLIKLSKKQESKIEEKKFITVVNLVRPRNLWVSKSLETLKEQIKIIDENNLKATWLLQYDTLKDQDLINLFKSLGTNHELGVFMEISQNQATDSGVSYRLAEGDYYQPNKVFLQGYKPEDRKKLIKGALKSFEKIYGKKPRSAGAWYIDAVSQNFLDKEGITSVLTVSDQFDTDGASIWGKYFSMPFYPSKFNTLEPAQNQSDKIPIVNIQWAQRHPVLGYGGRIKDSRQSFQANDYINNGFGSSYFDSLLSTYLNNKNSEFMQVTIGLETGQESYRFKNEYERQLKKISKVNNLDEAKSVTMEEFATWYKNKYPGISPSHFLNFNENFWYMSPMFRAAIFKENENYILKDLKYYDSTPFRDYLYSDNQPYLDRKVKSVIDNVALNNEVVLGPANKIEITEKFNTLILNLDGKKIKIDENGVQIDNKYIVKNPKISENKLKNKLKIIIILRGITNKIINPLTKIKYSVINNQNVMGIKISRTKLLGIRGKSIGIFEFNFQSLSKFKSIENFTDKWQPWIN